MLPGHHHPVKTAEARDRGRIELASPIIRSAPRSTSACAIRQATRYDCRP
jgi:hypothetical protein